MELDPIDEIRIFKNCTVNYTEYTPQRNSKRYYDTHYIEVSDCTVIVEKRKATIIQDNNVIAVKMIDSKGFSLTNAQIEKAEEIRKKREDKIRERESKKYAIYAKKESKICDAKLKVILKGKKITTSDIENFDHYDVKFADQSIVSKISIKDFTPIFKTGFNHYLHRKQSAIKYLTEYGYARVDDKIFIISDR